MKIITIVAIAALLAAPGSSAFAQFLPPMLGSGSTSASGWVAGGQLGYNWQRDSFVYGLEGDVSLMHLKSNMITTLPSPLPLFIPSGTGMTNASMDWYGTFRGRLGWAAGPVLFYGTGGVAYGNVELNSNACSGAVCLGSQAWSARVGWVAGGGIEFMARPNVIFNLGYQYVDLGHVNLASSTMIFGPSPFSVSATTHAQFQTVTAGVSWLFPAGDKGPHGAWEGMYVGGHAGGAWGERTNADYSAPVIAFSDARLKRDITLVGRRDDGLGLYSYRYLWSDTVYVGVMAQEVALIHPDAIVRGGLNDYLRVDYNRLGLKLMTLPEWDARSKGERL